jgi:Flp pilus assembly pilin Flp
VDPIALLAAHIAISLIGLVSGFALIRDFLHSRFRSSVVWIFLVFTTLTSVTGYLFQRGGVLPSHIVGGIALLVLVPTWLAWRPYCLFGGWRRVFVIGATISQWLNVFVLVAQGFQKVPVLHRLAPTGSEPPFGVAEAAVLLLFIAVAIVAWRKNRASSIRFD